MHICRNRCGADEDTIFNECFRFRNGSRAEQYATADYDLSLQNGGEKRKVHFGITGFCFETQNRKQLIESVRKFMRLSNEERRQMGLAGRRKMEREFDRRVVVEAYMKEIENGL